MESIGLRLKTIRESKKITLDMVARETNISRHYLASLEIDEFDAFPGESYLLGFLRTYSDYLGEDPNQFVNAYKNLKIQEEPVPVDLLFHQKEFPLLGVLITGGVLLLGVVLYFAGPSIGGFFQNMALSFQGTEEDNVQGTEYRLEEDFEIFRQRLFPGDRVIIPVDGLDLVFTLKAISNRVEIESEFGHESFLTKEDRYYDLTGDNLKDLRVFLDDLPDPVFGAAMGFEKIQLPEQLTLAEIGQGSRENISLDYTPTVVDQSQMSSDPVLILESPTAGPFIMEVVFLGNALFRYEGDGRSREEGYYQKGESLQVEAQRQIKLGVSNAGAVSAKIQGIEVDLGRQGEVAVHLLQWVRDLPSGPFQLKSFPLR